MLQNNQVNINIGSGLTRESRENVLNAVRSILAGANNNAAFNEIEEDEYEDVLDEDLLDEIFESKGDVESDKC